MLYTIGTILYAWRPRQRIHNEIECMLSYLFICLCYFKSNEFCYIWCCIFFYSNQIASKIQTNNVPKIDEYTRKSCCWAIESLFPSGDAAIVGAWVGNAETMGAVFDGCGITVGVMLGERLLKKDFHIKVCWLDWTVKVQWKYSFNRHATMILRLK